MDPNFPWGHCWLGQCYLRKEIFPEAIAHLQKASSLSGGSPQYVAALGDAYAVAGEQDEAQKTLDQLEELSEQNYVSPFNIAVVYTGLAKKNQAFKWLRKALAERSGWMTLLNVDPRFDGLRFDPRFNELLKSIGISHE